MQKIKEKKKKEPEKNGKEYFLPGFQPFFKQEEKWIRFNHWILIFPRLWINTF